VTHAEKVLQLLSDGKPHTHMEGYRLGVMLHSRVSDLRDRGYIIDCWRDGNDYLYQMGTVRENGNATTDGLAVSDRSPGQPSTAVPPAPQTPESAGAPWAGPASPSTVGPAQLSVFEAA